MARMPGAIWRPISHNVGGTLTNPNVVILHVDSGNSVSLFGWFDNPTAMASSHFFPLKNGNIEQYVDTSRVAWTSGQGNHRQIGVESQGRDGEPWTPQQCEAIAKILAWCHKTHGIPLRIVSSSHATESGVGWHRIGIDGNFPESGPLAGRLQRGGGEKWSGSRGKVCPGDDRIRQVPGIIARAKVLAGDSTPDPVVAQELDLSDEATRLLQQRIWTKVDGDIGPATKRALQYIFTGKNGDSKVAQVLGKQYGVVADSVLSDPSSLIKAMQAYLNAIRDAKGKALFSLAVDGIAGPATNAALEKYLTTYNGHFA